MHLQYIFADSAGKPHPFHVKSNWQPPPPQPSVALESYLERTKFEIATITFSNEKDNLSARQREALKTLSANKEIQTDDTWTTLILFTNVPLAGCGYEYSKFNLHLLMVQSSQERGGMEEKWGQSGEC